MSDRAADGLAAIVVVAVLIVAFVTAYAIWYVIAACIAAWRFHRYLERSKESYAKVAARMGADATPEVVCEMLGAMGLEVDRTTHYASVADYHSAIYFGVEEVEEKGA